MVARAQGQIRKSEILRRRLELGLSQADLADKAGVSHGAISKIETGASISVHPRTLRKLAEALGCAPLDIAQIVEVEEASA